MGVVGRPFRRCLVASADSAFDVETLVSFCALLRWFLAFFWRGEKGGRRGGNEVWSIVEVGRKVTMEEDADRIEIREP